MEEKLQELIPEIEILGSKDVRFKCSCSKEKIVASIATLHEDEIKEMIAEGHDFETRCEFCSRTYNITQSDLLESLSIRRGH
jgi:molecular chaperone Hsp33